MGSLNQVSLIGNLGRDAELKYTPSGSAVAKFSMATMETWKDKGGNRQERTEWHNVNLWGTVAEALAQYLTKGKQVFVQGSLHTREWEDQDGNKRRATDVKARTVVLLGGGASVRPAFENGGATAPPATQAPPPSELTEDDIPF